jgi:hypothetical protein
LTLGAAVAVLASARHAGAGRRASLVAALAFFSFPVVGMRLVDVNSDIAAAFPVIAAWVLAARAASTAEAAFLFPALCGVGVASKSYVAPAVLVLALALFGARLRALAEDGRSLAAGAVGTVVAALLCAGSYLPVHRLFGDLFGGDSGKSLTSYHEGLLGVPRTIAFSALRWAVEPFALVPEPPRFGLFERAGIPRAYSAVGQSTDAHWYPVVHAHKSPSGVFPILALPWLLAAVPTRERRWRGALLFLALFLSLVALLGPNQSGPRFLLVALAALAVLWGFRASRSPWLVATLLTASLAVDASHLEAPRLKEFAALQRPVPRQNRRIAAAVGAHPLWLLNGSLGVDAVYAGPEADVRFEYLSCPRDGDWLRLFREIRAASPWLLLNTNSQAVTAGPTYPTEIGPACPSVEVVVLQSSLASAGWTPEFQENGYQIWSAKGPRP